MNTNQNIFIVPKEIQEKFNKDVDKSDKTLVSHPKPIQTRTPPILLALNGYQGQEVNDLPFELDKWTLSKIQGNVKEKENSLSHALNTNHIKEILGLTYNPIAVLASDKNDGFVIITNAVNKNNRPIVISVHLNKTKQRVQVNDIATIFGRKNLDNWLSTRLDKVLYYNPELKNEKTKELYDSPNTTVDNNPLGVVHKSLISAIVLSPSNIVKRFNERKTNELITTLQRNFGKGTIDKLIADDKLVFNTLDEAREQTGLDIPNNADGFYLNGRAVLIIDNLSTKSVSAAFLHELGGHGGIQTLMSDKDHQSHLKRFDDMVDSGEPLAVQAKNLAHKNSPKHPQDEYIPYLITLSQQQKENTPKVSQFIKDVISSSKLFINQKFGLDIKLNANDFNILAKKQIQELANQYKAGLKQKIQAKFSQQTPSDEMALIRQRYKNTDDWLKAPNGNPTQLSEEQWLQVRTPSFKDWFGDWENNPQNASKVIDDNGEALVVQHNTSEHFTIFNMDKARQSMDIPAMFFSANPDNSWDYGDNEIKAFLNIRNITEKSDLGSQTGYEAKEELIKQGYDGTIVDDSYDGYIDIEYAVFNPNQIKSATDNIGTFDKNNDDIRFSLVSDERRYLYVPHEQKDEAKALGAKWDNANKAWYVSAGEEFSLAISTKTLNTQTAAKLKNPTQVYRAIKTYIDQTANFQKGHLSNVALNEGMIKKREAHLAIAADTTVAQWQQLQRAIDYGKSRGVILKITEIK